MGVQVPARAGNFLFTTASRLALGLTQPPIQWVPVALSLGVKRSGHEAGHSPPFSAEVKECVELYLHSPNTPSWCGAQVKHRDSFTFTFTGMIKWHVSYVTHPFNACNYMRISVQFSTCIFNELHKRVNNGTL
jgi:hypothetical protein